MSTPAMTTWLRIFFVGGLTSYRALFNWMSPWILIPSFLVAPIFQIALFVYLGRSIGVESDEFFVIGNALLYGALPCLFAMANTVDGEREQKTLGILLATPAPRLALFLGRSLPVIANGLVVSVFSLTVGGAIFGIDVPFDALLPVLLVTVICALSCTGLGLVNAAIGLRVRETAVLSNIIFGLLMIFCGVNLPIDALPEWMATVSRALPLTHGIDAARRLADGAALSRVGSLVATELVIGGVYVLVGMSLLRLLEAESRRRASLEIA